MAKNVLHFTLLPDTMPELLKYLATAHVEYRCAVCTCMCVCMCACARIICVCVRVCVYGHTYACGGWDLNVHVSVYVCAYVCVCAYL